MSGQLPTAPGYARVELTSDDQVAVSYSQSATRQARTTGGHLWNIRLTIPLQHENDVAIADAFALAQQGALETFQVELPNFKESKGSHIGDIQALSNFSQGSSTILAFGFATSTNGVMKARDPIIFQGVSSKVHILTQDVDSDVNGIGTLHFHPPLLEDVPAANIINTDGILFTVAFDKGNLKMVTEAPRLAKQTFNMIEAL